MIPSSDAPAFTLHLSLRHLYSDAGDGEVTGAGGIADLPSSYLELRKFFRNLLARGAYGGALVRVPGL